MSRAPSPNPHTIPADPASRTAAARSIIALKSCVARALAGGTDPSEDAEACREIEYLRGISTPDPEKMGALLDTLKDPSRLSGINRRVVLARAQRFLLTLSISIEDPGPTRTKRTLRESEPRENRADATITPVDPSLLTLKGVGPKTAARLTARGFSSPRDLLFCLPRRYDDRRTLTPIGALLPGMRVVTSGEIDQVRLFGRPWKRILELIVRDGEHTLHAMWFSNRRPGTDQFVKGQKVLLTGLVGSYKGRPQMAHPVIVDPENPTDRVGRIVPIYPEIPDIPGRTVEKAIRSAIERIDEFIADPIPLEQLNRRALSGMRDALRDVHIPPDDVDQKCLDAWIDGSSPAHRRLAYDEFFYLQLALLRRREQDEQIPAPDIRSTPTLFSEVVDIVGFPPTTAQSRVVAEILADMASGRPMRRLLQGDVGSGKTLVAAAAIFASVRAGYQAALMAPTEILAEQHMRTLSPMFAALGIRCALHIGNARSSTRKKSLKDFESGLVQVAIGTHALIQESVSFQNLALAVVDEQHRFGVSQRLGLVGKAREGGTPHLLVMTATPIPRTLALTVHGDLDASVLDELPPGRQPVETMFLPEENRETALCAVDEAITRGEQAYVVCPIIDESEKLDVSAASQVFEELKSRFGEGRTALLHSRLSSEVRDSVMEGFLRGDIAVLVATTVIEVGVNVPNATVMVIEGAERFGLAQLHQLRGRVGRCHLPSRCFLVGSPRSEQGLSRMNILVSSTDGFRIAEEDLQNRGPGELYGLRQAGLPGFRFGNLARDLHLLEWAREDAMAIAPGIDRTDNPDMTALRDELTRRILTGDGPVGEEAG